jgi:hypothetical protein
MRRKLVELNARNRPRKSHGNQRKRILEVGNSRLDAG